MTQILSMCILGELFFCVYDFPALLFMSIGCAMIVSNANTTETIQRTRKETLEILLTPLFITYVVITIIITICAFISLRTLLKHLLVFERNARLEDERNQQKQMMAEVSNFGNSALESRS